MDAGCQLRIGSGMEVDACREFAIGLGTHAAEFRCGATYQHNGIAKTGERLFLATQNGRRAHLMSSPLRSRETNKPDLTIGPQENLAFTNL